ncbi:MFS transporter [Sporichthya polymorpha]|uniref:MFS transporter n=1 Tax=Sporichthya polymorpha TaxID=35751 RepID=UPI000368F885|nr:MFS transporter [Sporichthya polymorpha]
MSFASDFRAVVQHRDFRKLYATRLAGQASDGMFQMALASYVFFSPERQADAGAAAAALATLLLPYTVVGPFAGVYLDRWRRRHVLVRANLVRAGLVGVVAALAWTGVTGAALFATALVAISINRFFLTTLGAALPHVVDRDDLIMANSVSATSGTMASLAGGGLGLALHQSMAGGRGTDAALMLAAVAGYLCSALLARRIERDLLGPDGEVPAMSAGQALRTTALGLASGARHVWARPMARNCLAVLAVQRFCYGTGTIATLLLYRNYFNDPEHGVDAAMRGLGLVFGAAGAGFFVAATITPVITRRIGKPAWIVLALTAAAVFGFALVAPYEPPPLVLGAFLLGIAAQSVKLCVDTIVQESVEDAFRGRVFALADMLFNLAFVGAAAVASLVMPESGKSYALLTAVSIGYALTAVLFLRTALKQPATASAPASAALSPGPG